MQILNNKNIKDIYKLSPMQESMYYQYLLDKSSSAYFQQMTFRINQKINIDTVKSSIQEIFNRHDILRTVFNHQKVDFPLQIVLKVCEPEIHYEDITSFEDLKQKKYIKDYVSEDKSKLFNLNKDILMRIAVFKTGEESYDFVWSFHHILMDGWCAGIIISEFFKIYNIILKGNYYDLPVVNQYRSYISWLEKQDETSFEEYWKDYVDGYDKAAQIPRKTSYNKINSYLKDEVNLDITDGCFNSLKMFASKNEVTINTVIQTLWGVILSKYNFTDDVVFGRVVSGRPPEIIGIESMVGLFINTIPLRIKYKKDKRIIDIMKDLQTDSMKNKKFDYYPLYKIQSKSSLKQNLIDHILVFENYPVDEYVNENIKGDDGIDESMISDFKVSEQTNYDLNIIASVKDKLSISFQFNSNVFDKRLIKNIALQFELLINELVENYSIKVDEMTLLSDKEKDEIINNFNNTSCEYPKDKKIYNFLSEQAEKSPNSLAVRFNDKKMTYKELNERSNRLGRFLREKGVSSNTIVGIMVDRSFEMIVGIIGILKAGGCYMPISSKYPKERIKYILNDSKCAFLLVENDLYDDLECRIINLNDESIYYYDEKNLKDINSSKNMAYVIYTSGSTGNPKGVMINHTSVINRINWMQKKYHLDKDDVILQKTPYTFDVSVWELFWWMYTGSSVYLLKEGAEKDPSEIIKAVEENNISQIHFVPSMLNIFLDYVEENEEAYRLSSLKNVFASGEALSEDNVRKFYRVFKENKRIKLHNLYGPTEATVDVTYYDCNDNYNITKVPIGAPIDNIKIYILDENENLMPRGVQGEICISGVGVSEGYLNKPDLTKEKFKDDPFISGYRMYKTGDVGILSLDGNIEYLGRLDNQVKIRGFRIELEEIENALSSYSEIKNVVVCAKKNEKGINTLYAYIESNSEISTRILREYLKTRIPQYMIPSYFIKINEIPLTRNGKIDRNFIKEKVETLHPDNEYIAPETEKQIIVADIWKEVLKVREVGLNDNFFELGGTSLDIISVMTKINKRFDKKIDIVKMFTYPTVNAFCKFLNNEDDTIEEESHKALDEEKLRMKESISKINALRKNIEE